MTRQVGLQSSDLIIAVHESHYTFAMNTFVHTSDTLLWLLAGGFYRIKSGRDHGVHRDGPFFYLERRCRRRAMLLLFS